MCVEGRISGVIHSAMDVSEMLFVRVIHVRANEPAHRGPGKEISGIVLVRCETRAGDQSGKSIGNHRHVGSESIFVSYYRRESPGLDGVPRGETIASCERNRQRLSSR